MNKKSKVKNPVSLTVIPYHKRALVTVEAVAKSWHCGHSNVRNLIMSGALSQVARVGHTALLDKAQVEAYRNKHKGRSKK